MRDPVHQDQHSILIPPGAQDHFTFASIRHPLGRRLSRTLKWGFLWRRDRPAEIISSIRPSSPKAASLSDVTRILSQIEAGDPSAADQLLPLVYAELRKLAAAKLAHEKPGQTLEATALVHEAYLRLADVAKAQHWHSRRHFFSAAAEAMRRILVETARRNRWGSTS